MHDIWVEVRRDALENNYGVIRGLLSKGTRLCCVVKSNGYGHGIAEVSRVFADLGADYLAVTHIDEARMIREAGIGTPILVFMNPAACNIAEALELGLELTVSSERDAVNISRAAADLGKTARVHVKVDTGMGRLGVRPGAVTELFRSMSGLRNTEVAGIYTHFARSGELDIKFTQQQFARFRDALTDLKRHGFDYGLAHCCNSGAALRFPDMHMDMVRVGTSLYGQFPSIYAKKDHITLQNTWQLCCRVCEIKELLPGDTVGYGSEFVAKRPMTCAVISAGFGDGFTMIPEALVYRMEPLRFLAKKRFRKRNVRIAGAEAAVLGKVAMQMTIVDITDIRDRVHIDDRVELDSMRIPVNSLVPRVII
ncbi:MAG: alanine racemase [Abditibacteriota bacterium]|nr:alanine racemase [Abditibacteriota bacterium]